jgi:hypothetical protein
MIAECISADKRATLFSVEYVLSIYNNETDAVQVEDIRAHGKRLLILRRTRSLSG